MFRYLRNRKIFLAALTDDTALLERTLHRGGEADAYRDSVSRFNALHAAVEANSNEAVKVLLASGADPQAQCAGGRRPIHLATASANRAGARFLLDAGADVQAEDDLGNTPLHTSASGCARFCHFGEHEDHLAMLALLIESGANPNARNKKGETPLFPASFSNGSAAAVRTLLDAGADVDAQNNSGATALFWADGPGVVELLLERGANVNHTDQNGWTALKAAAFSGIHARKVEILHSRAR